MKIEVTHADIDAGNQNRLKNYCEGAYNAKCPVALAIARCLGGERVRVDHLRIQNDRLYIDTPRVVYEFMVEFDNGKTVNPFTFEIPLETVKATDL